MAVTGVERGGTLDNEGEFGNGLSLYLEPPKATVVCYWLRTLQVSPTGFLGLGMADFAMSQALHVEADAVF